MHPRHAAASAALLLTTLALAACDAGAGAPDARGPLADGGGGGGPDADAAAPCEPPAAPLDTLPVRATAPDYSAREYADECRAALGEIPAFDCYEGQEIEITVTSDVPVDAAGEATGPGVRTVVQEIAQLENGTRCDRPFQIGLADDNAGPGRTTSCVPHSRLGVKHGRDAAGNETDFVFICRAYYFRTPDARGHVRFDDLGFIGHNPATGATCYWAVPINANPPGQHATTDHSFEGDVIPAPGSDDGGFWKPPSAMARSRCMGCHTNDPFIHAPVVEATGLLPSRPLGPYWAVAGDRFNALANVADGEPRPWNAARHMVGDAVRPCTTCHRISDGLICDALVPDAAGVRPASTSSHAYAAIYPLDTWMNTFDATALRAVYPTRAQWLAAFGPAVDAIAACCATPDAPGCAWDDVSGPVCCLLPDGSHRTLAPDDCASRSGAALSDRALCNRPSCR